MGLVEFNIIYARVAVLKLWSADPQRSSKTFMELKKKKRGPLMALCRNFDEECTGGSLKGLRVGQGVRDGSKSENRCARGSTGVSTRLRVGH